MKEIKTFTISLKEVYECTTAAIWDLNCTEGTVPEEVYLKACFSPEMMAQAFKQGYAPCLLPNFIDIETYVCDAAKELNCAPDDVPFIIVITHNNKIWCLFDGSKMSW